MSPPLPKWRPRRTIIDLYNEKDHTPWYWRFIATLSASSIMLGFLIFPSSFKPDAALTISNEASTLTALILLALGYVLSTATALLCKSWLFRFDVLLIPCLMSCLLGFANVVYHFCVRSGTPHWTNPAVAAIAISVASAVAYALTAMWTFRKIYIVRSRDVMHRHHSTSPTEKFTHETELQRQQLLRLLEQQQQTTRNGNSEINSSTFKLDWPINGERRNTRSTLGTLRNLPRAARDVYESRTNSMYSRQDPANALPAPMYALAEEAPPSPGLPPLPSTAFSPRINAYDDAHIPGTVNTRSYTQGSSLLPPPSHLPRLQGNGYPIEKPPVPDLDERHPSERRQNEYHIVEEDQPAVEFRMREYGEQLRSVSRASARSREDRRVEIELSERRRGRDEGLKREDLDGIDFVPSIRRVESDGFGRHIADPVH